MDKIAILIGNSNYINLPNLTCCMADVEAVNELLQAGGKYNQIEVLTDKNAAQTKDKLRDILNTNATNSSNEIFFYFSGHGHQGKDDFYFCATDFDELRPNETGLSQSELHTLLRATNPELVIKVVDACNSGTQLIKSESLLFQEPKSVFQNFIQMASCLNDQRTLTGNPLSIFTQRFKDAVLGKLEGPLYYFDIINSLRDSYQGNDSQTPHFVVQSTGRELFAERAASFEDIRSSIAAMVAELDAVCDDNAGMQEIDAFDRLSELDASYVSEEEAKKFVSGLLAAIEIVVTSSDMLSKYFEFEASYFDGYYDQRSEEFMARTLKARKRPDNFVEADVWQETSRQTNSLGLPTVNPFALARNRVTHYDVELKCSMGNVQLLLKLLPRLKSIHSFELLVSCAPSLTKCYVFEFPTRNAPVDWNKYDQNGVPLNRRWYELDWGQSTETLVEKIRDGLVNVVESHTAKIIEQHGLNEN